MGRRGKVRSGIGGDEDDDPWDREDWTDKRGSLALMACGAVPNIVKSSLGPVGLDKMLVDDIGDVTITNDGATILQMLEVEHPAAKVLVELAELQDREVGDGTTSVVIIAAELLKRGNDLVKNKIHPTSIISGYRLAMREACKYVEEKLAVKVRKCCLLSKFQKNAVPSHAYCHTDLNIYLHFQFDKLGKDSLINSAKTSMSSKLITTDSDYFAAMKNATSAAHPPSVECVYPYTFYSLRT
ncbi:T-complex protein 1 subunit alpha-like [Setaria italica]|uniref:T-complex protein 1 subunit alpha-like n=1 Tax=Setaria italica TaxID=4555 RepID=UPI000BE55B2A|nr:T-complex protein 1 subunit alpha-like [Setaria italica]